MKTILIPLFSAILCVTALRAQPYVEGGETRYRFAQTYLGAGVQYIPGDGSSAWNGEKERTEQLSSVIAPAISIGGVHFWGHADFYIAIPVAALAMDAELPDGFAPGIGTGAKFFPWRLEYGAVRPYLGFEWSLFSYQGGSAGGPALYLHRLEPQAGVVIATPVGSFDAGVRFTTVPTVEYPTSVDVFRGVMLPAATLSIAYSFPFETTLSAEALAAGGREQLIEHHLAAQGRLDGPTIGAGFSSAFTLTRTDAVGIIPALDLPVPPALFPEVNIGYYHHDLDAALNLAYRSIGQEQEGYGAQQQWQRRAFTLEGIKFIGDYNGFVPFIGAMLSRESADYRENTSTYTVKESRDGWSAGLVFGWDIRPNRLQWFTIRTAVRYTPVFDVPLSETAKASFDQLEVNFFQFVVYPTRLF